MSTNADNLKDKAENAWEKFEDKVEDGWDKIEDKAESLWNQFQAKTGFSDEKIADLSRSKEVRSSKKRPAAGQSGKK